MINFLRSIIQKIFGIFKNNASMNPDSVQIYLHSCQGLNDCKNQGYSGSNNCAGSGTCATGNNHSCQTDNNCKFQGGCGYLGKSVSGQPEYNVRQNDCKGLGGCQSPISPKQYFNSGEYAGQTVWGIARTLFEQNYNGTKPVLPVGPVTQRRKDLDPTSPIKTTTNTTAEPTSTGPVTPVNPNLHSCQGLNNCKDLGYSGSNSCAGVGTCATGASHECQTSNSCEYQGGCGYPGKTATGKPAYNVRQNSCKGNGGCQSPISPKQYFNKGEYAGQETWTVARKLFEENYKGTNPIQPSGPVTTRRKEVKPTSPKD